jgi:4-hydroxybutyrate CoA-transferase
MSRRPKKVTAHEAVQAVGPGMMVATGGLSAEPIPLLEALAERCRSVEGVTLLCGMLIDGYRALSPALGNEIRLETWFMPQTLLGDVAFGPNVDFLPMSWTQTCRYVRSLDIDVCLVQVSPADENGFHSLGISAGMNPIAVERSRVVIAQVNDEMPYTFGNTLVHESRIDFVVEEPVPLVDYPHRQPDVMSDRIGRRVADLISDDSTLQAGIGTIPESVLRCLVEDGRRGLMLTAMLTDSGRELIESGSCISDAPAAVIGEVCGTSDLYRWVQRNPAVELQDGFHTHNLETIMTRRNFVSINSTLEVDLFGQMNSEVLKSGQAGGIGGSVDFMLGAQFEGAMSIVALPSVTTHGSSRIVPQITRGIVTAARTLLQFVVTEHGVADLRFLSAARRAEALAEISHPDHREELLAAAKRLTRIG